MTTLLVDRVSGVLVGLAVGDALGAPVEFDRPAMISDRREELFTLPGGGYFDWAPAEFTDDTQMAIVLARHLEQHGGQVNQDALACDFATWTQDAADVGVQTRKVLSIVSAGGDWREAAAGLPPTAEGNGCLMRVAPVALSGTNREDVIVLARAQAEITHPSPICLAAAAVFAWILRGTLETGQVDIDEAIASAQSPEIRDALEKSKATKIPPMSGLVLHTLTGALWAVQRGTCFEDAVWNAVCLGHDADTVGAVAGALAGARWGYSGIPREFSSKIQSRHPAFAGRYPALLQDLARRLFLRANWRICPQCASAAVQPSWNHLVEGAQPMSECRACKWRGLRTDLQPLGIPG